MRRVVAGLEPKVTPPPHSHGFSRRVSRDGSQALAREVQAQTEAEGFG